MLRHQISTEPLVISPTTAPHLLLLQSPFAANKWMFADFQAEWLQQHCLRDTETHHMHIEAPLHTATVE